MRSALRAAMAHLARRLVFATIAAGAVIAFIAIADGTDAQTDQQATIVPAEVTPSAQVTASPQSTVVAGDVTSAAPARPLPESAPPTVKPKLNPRTTPAAPAPAPSTTARTGAANIHHQAKPVISTSTGPSVYHYVGYRDIAAMINPARAVQGWVDVSTTAAKQDAGCLARNSCAGQVGACGLAPASIGTADTLRVYDGQYRDQYGSCREIIVS
jgi:hypothetical protein